ncbi:NUDIX hydrolase [Photobacterium leiognathi]|uniref:NUDIX hydrolase n=1 Tax=Photobacterium leiognathi TaxID=553611 RepID=UPI00273A3BA7|nr:NUDIX hydrolase [Photobacterium leiognathi]
MSSKIHYQWKCFSIEEQAHLLPNNKQVNFTTIKHPGAVVIIPINSQGHIVLVNQYRPAIKQWILEFPAGTLEPNEDVFECAKRELAEEVNLKADSWQSLGELLPVPFVAFDEIQYLFVATDLTPTIGELDDDEIIEVVTLSVQQVEQKIAQNEIQDNKTLAAFLKARLAGYL